MSDSYFSDLDIERVLNSMPDGVDGFLKSWGYRQFARAVLREAQAQAMSNDRVRDEFEKWCATSVFKTVRDGDEYANLNTQSAWNGWKAARTVCIFDWPDLYPEPVAGPHADYQSGWNNAVRAINKVMSVRKEAQR